MTEILHNSGQVNEQAILDFWFEEISPKLWWAKSDEFDQQIGSRFGALHQAASRCDISMLGISSGWVIVLIFVLF